MSNGTLSPSQFGKLTKLKDATGFTQLKSLMFEVQQKMYKVDQDCGDRMYQLRLKLSEIESHMRNYINDIDMEKFK